MTVALNSVKTKIGLEKGVQVSRTTSRRSHSNKPVVIPFVVGAAVVVGARVVIGAVVVVESAVVVGAMVVVTRRPGVQIQLWIDGDKAVPALHKRNVPIALQAWL